MTVTAVVDVGGRDEPPELAGVSHMLEHLLCRGTARISTTELADAVDSRGGELDAFTDRERTAVSVRVPATDLDFAVDLVGGLVLHPALRPEDVEVERSVILEELHLAQEDHEDCAHALAAEALYPHHPLGREVLGDEATLRSISATDVSAFHAGGYRPERLVVAVAGAVDHDRVAASLAAWTVPDPSSPPRSSGREAPGPSRAGLTVRRRAGEQAHIVTGWRVPALDDADRDALGVLAHLLGGGPASRLFRRVRDDLGLAYAVEASAALTSDAGALWSYAGTAPDRVGLAREVVAQVASDLSSKGPASHEVDVARGYLAGSLTVALEDTGVRAGRMADELLRRGAVRPAAESVAALRQVDVADVARIATAVLGPPPVVAVVGPVRRRDVVIR